MKDRTRTSEMGQIFHMFCSILCPMQAGLQSRHYENVFANTTELCDIISMNFNNHYLVCLQNKTADTSLICITVSKYIYVADPFDMRWIEDQH